MIIVRLAQDPQTADMIEVEAIGLMAVVAIPDEIARHIEIAFSLSKREVFLRLLDQADVLIQFDQLASATVLAGIVLEEAQQLPSLGSATDAQIDLWYKMRNRATHSGTPEFAVSDVKAMVANIRRIVTLAGQNSHDAATLTPSESDTLARIRGKYAFVRTSVAEFLRRKHEDMELEDR